MRFFLDGEGEATAAGAEALRFSEAAAGEFTTAVVGVEALRLSGDGAAADGVIPVFSEPLILIDGEAPFSYEYCFSDAPKLLDVS